MILRSWIHAVPSALLAANLLSGGTAPSAAQIPQQLPTSSLTDTLPDVGEVSRGASFRGPLLERTISRTEYLLGPSDVLDLSIFGFRSHSYSLTVTPEGTLVIPTVGVVTVAGMNLEDAQREVARRVRRYYQDVDVRLSLSAVRSFKVFLVGDIPNPGVREANAVTRVSEVIPARTEDGVARRSVFVRRASGEIVPVDMARFLYLGELEHNPVLREGDMIQVPPADRVVRVQGRVVRPGDYEIRPGETLADILDLANVGGSFRANAADTLRLLRFGSDPEGETVVIAREDATGRLGRGLRLEPFDAIFVPALSHYRRARTATVTGEVLRPGTYPIEPDVTTVQELVEMAGGFTPHASLVNAQLRRLPRARVRDADEQIQNIPSEYLSDEERRILQLTNRGDDRNVVLDFREVFLAQGSALEVLLRDGDQLIIPEMRNEVTVIGAVVEPGIVSFEPGQGVDYFVNRAGGYAERADRRDVVVLKAKLQNRVHRKDVAMLEPGDQIVVPFKEPVTFMDRVRSAQSVMNTLSGVVLTVVGLQRIWDAIS